MISKTISFLSPLPPLAPAPRRGPAERGIKRDGQEPSFLGAAGTGSRDEVQIPTKIFESFFSLPADAPLSNGSVKEIEWTRQKLRQTRHTILLSAQK